MVRINPFQGITYNLEKIESPKHFIAPPYDVISPEYQEELYNRSEYNVVRLILGKILENDTEKDNRYTRARASLMEWLKNENLVKSDVPKIYYYVQEYKDNKGNFISRKGFISRCYLEDFSDGKILPHEETMGGPKQDRIMLTEATNSNLSQVYGIYSDPEREVDNVLEHCCSFTKPFIDLLDDDGVRHVFYEISDEKVIQKVKENMADKVVLIADGHHRYETALNYRNKKKEELGFDESEDVPYNSVMMYLANLDDDGLRVYPTHRMLKKSVGIKLDGLMKKIKPYFEVIEKPIKKVEDSFEIFEKEDDAALPIGFLCQENKKVFYIFKPNVDKVKSLLEKENVPSVLLNLDVSILHKLIFEHLYHLDPVELKNQNNIEFVRDEEALVEKFNANVGETVFLLKAPNLAAVKDICESGYRMPQKSTYFYPKLLSGLVINSLDV